MRISTSMIYDLGVNRLQQQTSDLIKVQQQVAAGRRILSPSDDPIASARVLEVSQSSSLNKQYDTNMNSASSALGLEDAILTSIENLIQDVRTTAVNGGNATLSNSDRVSLAAELRGRYQDLLGLANSTDGNGQYLFSGYRGDSMPFAETSPGTVAYSGDQGQRLMQVSTSRQIAVSDSGSDIFLRGKEGNGTFVTAASVANAGNGVISPGNPLDLSKWNSATNNKDFTILFDVDSAVTPPVTTYDIKDNVTGFSLLTGVAPATPYPRAYSSGSTISLKSQGAEPAFDFGADLVIQGTPADNDAFTVQASANKNIFSTINDLVSLLESSVSGSAGFAKLTNGLNTALSDLDASLDNVLTVRASVGARMRENDAVKSTGADLQLQYQQTISNLQDLDYAKAITDLTRQQTNLQASQQSFMKVQSLSLFNYM